jgi:hypothetical protein
MSVFERFLIILYVLPFALDFKGVEDGGSFAQFFYLALVFISAAVLLLGLIRQKKKFTVPRAVKSVVVVWWSYLISSVLTAIVSDVEFGNYIRVLMPFVLCGISMLLSVLFYSRGRDLTFFFYATMIAVVISVIWTPIYTFGVLGIPVAGNRYQMLSPVLPVLLGYFLCVLVSRRGFSIPGLIALMVFVSLVALSVSRSYLIVFVLTSSYLYFVMPNFYRHIIKRKLVLISFFSCGVFVFLVPILEAIKPGFIFSWVDRLFGVRDLLGFDPTTMTRLAEYKGQMDILLDDPVKLLLGAGLGSEYRWSSSYFTFLSEIFSLRDLEELVPWEVGHSLWVYSLYSGGLMFGFLIPFCICRGVYLSSLAVRSSFSSLGSLKSREVVFFALLLGSIVSTSFTSNPFGVRLTGLLLGFGMILPLLLLSQSLLRQSWEAAEAKL